MSGSGPYNDTVMDHFMNPRNMGEVEDPDAVGEAGSLVCGDVIRIYFRVNENVISDVRFKTFGCGAAIASSSILTEMVKGKTIEQALRITNESVVEALGGLPEAKIHCSVLAEDAVLAAVRDYFLRTGLDPAEADNLKRAARDDEQLGSTVE